jgi:molybdopterin converting factor small subunit
MQLRFYANMRTVTGLASLDVEEEQVDTFRKVIVFLIERFPHVREHLLDAEGELRQDVPVFVDGRNPRLSRDGIDALLAPEAVISFFSPISSGRLNVEILRKPNARKGAVHED